MACVNSQENYAYQDKLEYFFHPKKVLTPSWNHYKSDSIGLVKAATWELRMLQGQGLND